MEFSLVLYKQISCWNVIFKHCYYLLFLFILTANRFLSGGSVTVIRHSKQHKSHKRSREYYLKNVNLTSPYVRVNFNMK
jgi:hypothetical protein